MLVLSTAALGLTLAITPALKMDGVVSDNHVVLVLHDCGRGDGLDPEKECEAWETHFAGAGPYVDRLGRHYYKWRDESKEPFPYEGDAARLRQILGANKIDEVWLVSGGGLVSEGLEIGRLFRRYGLTVRVPNRTRLGQVTKGPKLETNGMCASSCTIAFMGGLFRYVDPGAPFLVHSASGAMSTLDDETRKKLEAGKFRDLAAEEQGNACLMGLRLVRHFQNGLLQLVRRNPEPEDDNFIMGRARDCQPDVPYPDSMAVRDRRRYAVEGIGAGQDIMMRIERSAMHAALDFWKSQIASLGPRAGPALRMIEAMYDVAIVETSGLTEETLIRMGYVTQDAAAPPP